MKFVDEYRDPALAGQLLAEIRQTVTRPWVIMEICGGHTHAIMKNGLDQLLPAQLELVHGPGCPVCVTPVETIDRAVAIAARPEVIFTSFGDMLRVPGSASSLFMAKSTGADVRMVYSPLEAVALARQHPEREVVFFAVGFETTAPGNGMALLQAKREGLTNFSLLASHVLVPPAIRALLSSPTNRVQGYLAPGHVCTVMGWQEYESLAEEFRVPIVPTGFEPVDILAGLLMALRQLEAGRYVVENQYGRSVSREGNRAAQRVMAEVFTVRDRAWRGIGVLPASGLVIRDDLAGYDAERKFAVESIRVRESELCQSGSVLQGLIKPDGCPAFGRECTPEHPLGATMVSGEGACAAYYRYHRTSHA
ncbi:hydrogenase formation protein HypD [Thiovibrio frasassiensis]|uniref:Hydrogenase formation protein HypD n=1 Tax=Thiovibrio frasassiensis TaxID=2984131 RepID=A0A9X4MJS6_9BACT|nr:hydrogenase formation protein HypD [Thiovibrio frasassiensis]MDG4476149.1 hydrogenase formation protein HypD [Thiovibrio frasassiensis]